MTGATGPDCVFLGDDFTGASDTLATFSRAGWQSRLFLEPPEKEAIAGLKAVGLATALRSMSPDQMRAEIARVMPQLAVLGAPRFHYKICSTFDSGVEIGSIGAAITAIAEHLKPALTIIVGGQPSLGRYCQFGTLFATAPDGNVHRIDRHPVMARHPVTPMTEADLRRHLACQGATEIDLVSTVTLDQGVQAAANRFRKARAGGILLVDAVRQAHIECLGEALRAVQHNAPLLLVGSSGVAEALCPGPVDAPVAPALGQAAKAIMHIRGPVFLFAGSRSSVTAKQIEAARAFQKLQLSPETLSGSPALAVLVADARLLLEAGNNVLVHLDAEADYRVAPDLLAQASASFVARVTEGVPLAGLGVAGGDTSSMIVRSLGARSLSHVSDIDRGVALCRAEKAGESQPMLLLLKGGQMGAVDLFDRFAALAGL